MKLTIEKYKLELNEANKKLFAEQIPSKDYSQEDY